MNQASSKIETSDGSASTSPETFDRGAMLLETLEHILHVTRNKTYSDHRMLIQSIAEEALKQLELQSE